MNGPDFLDRQLGQPAAALRLRAQRLDLIASNIANAATPGYKARDLDFKAALAAAEGSGNTSGAIRYRVPVQASLDGNTVELATEQTAFAENAIDYRASLSFLGGRIQTIMAALKGGE
ncbi:flagellar basal body rod protein FlgB [Sandarakinorhabdus sp. DWP1-3-1]|uniref:flagellar basal body rod protein FlgB n=1 Tax=Sandarakinorhabdus sp. DWP1-3-1 TaxID=2804627 RepID=UPI003CE7D08C